MADIKRQFSKKLKTLRTKAGYSILRLARESEVSRQHIRDLELANKDVTLGTLCKLANGLRVPMWKMVDFRHDRCAV